MSKILFKSPLVQITKLPTGVLAPAEDATWTDVTSDKIAQDSCAINSTAGTSSKLYDDNGGVVGSYTSKTESSGVFRSFKKIAEIVDVDGVVADEFAIRILDKVTNKGYQIDRAEVSAMTNYNATDGEGTTYTFNAQVPAAGNMVKEYPLATP